MNWNIWLLLGNRRKKFIITLFHVNFKRKTTYLNSRIHFYPMHIKLRVPMSQSIVVFVRFIHSILVDVTVCRIYYAIRFVSSSWGEILINILLSKKCSFCAFLIGVKCVWQIVSSSYQFYVSIHIHIDIPNDSTNSNKVFVRTFLYVQCRMCHRWTQNVSVNGFSK